MSLVRALIFDMDGLMFDTESVYSQVGERVLSKRGRHFTLDLKRKIMGLTLPEVWSYLKNFNNLKDNVDDLVKEARQTFVDLLTQDTLLRPLPGLVELLSAASRVGLKLAVATSSEKRWVDLLLSRYNLQNYFSTIITSENINKGKPNPEIYLKAVAAVGYPAERCLVLEDALNGIKSAKAAGCLAVAVPNQYTKDQDFSLANLVVDSLADPQLWKLIFD